VVGMGQGVVSQVRSAVAGDAEARRARGSRIVIFSSLPLICVVLGAGAGEAAELAGLPVQYDMPLGVAKSMS